MNPTAAASSLAPSLVSSLPAMIASRFFATAEMRANLSQQATPRMNRQRFIETMILVLRIFPEFFA
jgi:hypothetical protein